MEYYFKMQFPWGKESIKLGRRQNFPCNDSLHSPLTSCIAFLSVWQAYLKFLSFWHSPLTTFRDNLMIALYDAKGNKISYTGLFFNYLLCNVFVWFHPSTLCWWSCFGPGVETRLVVEKGLWDDIFSLEGGGHVHLRLQFVLTEDERYRIRIMVQSVLHFGSLC